MKRTQLYNFFLALVLHFQACLSLINLELILGQINPLNITVIVLEILRFLPVRNTRDSSSIELPITFPQDSETGFREYRPPREALLPGSPLRQSIVK